jgi:ferrous iron transport protein B
MDSCCHSATVAPIAATRRIALAGNPNSGKTTLFNALTGARQRVGNWPGVTVERKSGMFAEGATTIEVVDLPGTYSLTQASTHAAVDEHLAVHYLLSGQVDAVVNIVDASNLERHLYLTLQLREMGLPVILVLNMMDVARARGLHINTAALSSALGCQVIAIEAKKSADIANLKRQLLQALPAPLPLKLNYPAAIQAALTALKPDTASRWQALSYLEGDADALQTVHTDTARPPEADVFIPSTRYAFVSELVKCAVRVPLKAKPTLSSRLDTIVLNRVLGLPIFLCVMYALFFFAINVGGAFQDFFDISSQVLFVDGFAHLLNAIGSPNGLTVILANGLGKGINTTLTFIPVIGAMFLFLSLLEDSGYMARAAFVVDRFMRALGLSGKAFVPMIVGFGCNVPAVMGARTLENKRDRILTILMAPFMSCGARLAIFAVFTSAFFPHGGQNIVFALYLIGIGMAVLTGFLLRQTLLKGQPAPLIMELPPYHWPHLKTLSIHAWQRLSGFVVRAGRLIVPICMVIGALNAFNLDGTLSTGDADTHSLLSLVGQWVTPVFSPMGVHADNWPATVGLVTGVLAKEVVIGTLNTLYAEIGHLSVASSHYVGVLAGLKAAVLSVPQNLHSLGQAVFNPVLAQAPVTTLNQGVYGLMAERFDGKAGAFAYLLFVLLYFPCVSTMAAMLRELHRGWAVFSGFWMTGVAYATAVVFYQAATFFRHPFSSSVWIAAMLSAFLITVFALKHYSKHARFDAPVQGNLACGGGCEGCPSARSA